MAMLYGYCTGQGCYVTTSTGVTRAASAAESAVLQGVGGGGGYIDTADTPATPDASAPAPRPVSPVTNPAPAAPAPPTPGSSLEGHTVWYGPGANFKQAPTTPAPWSGPSWGQTPAPANYGWGTGFTGSHAGASSPFAGETGTQQAYYQLHPDQANYLLRTWLAPNASSPLNQYLAGRESDMTKDFATASAQSAQPNLQYTDWLRQNFSHYVDQFAGQSATQRQENPLNFGGGFAGRFTG
jgi:hypothetical protein